MLSIGLMSGTSMDGIDAALLETDGDRKIQEINYLYIPYDLKFKNLLKTAEYAVRNSKGDMRKASQDYAQRLCREMTLEEIIKTSTMLHVQAVQELLVKTGKKSQEIDLIGYHGQTLFHSPADKITIQIGDGQYLADQTGIFVIDHFRYQDIKQGGQGAPLAPLYHQALAVRDQKYPIIILNCGGIANMTVITGETLEEVIGFDTGPGNKLIDEFVSKRTDYQDSMDKDGKYGKKGNVNNLLLSSLYQQMAEYLTQNPPKSLDSGDLVLPEEFNDPAKISLEDGCATLEAFTVKTIVDALQHIKSEIPKRWVLAGGGWHNPVILHKLEQYISSIIKTVKIYKADRLEIGWNSQAMEAQLMAFLAVRSLKNLPITLPRTTGVSKPLSGGQGYMPDQRIENLNLEVRELLQKNPKLVDV